MGKGLPNRVQHGFEHQLAVPEAQLHFGGVDVHVQKLRFYGKVQQGEGVFVLHHVGLVRFLDGFGNDAALDIPSVDEIVFIIPVAAGDQGFADKTGYLDILRLDVDGQQVGGYLPAVNRIHQIPQIVVSRGIEFVLVILDEAYGDFRVGQGDLLHQVRHVGSLGHRALEEFFAGGRVVEQIPGDKGGAVRRAHLLQAPLRSALDLIAEASQAVSGFGDQLHLGHSRDAGQGLAPKPKGGHGEQVLHGFDLAGGVTQEGQADLVFGNAAAVVRHPDQGGSALLDLNGHGCGLGVDGVFQQFLHHGGRALDHLARGDFIDGILVKYRYVSHGISLLCRSFAAFSRCCGPYGQKAAQGKGACQNQHGAHSGCV